MKSNVLDLFLLFFFFLFLCGNGNRDISVRMKVLFLSLISGFVLRPENLSFFSLLFPARSQLEFLPSPFFGSLIVDGP